MPRLIDADELRAALDGYQRHITLIKKRHRKIEEAILADVKGIIDSAPEVVRCKDCKFWNYKKLMCECPEWADMDGWHKCSDADDYCFRAERKEKTDVE